jgi:hypothetical protein
MAQDAYLRNPLERTAKLSQSSRGRQVKFERMANMTTIVGILDNARDLDEAIEQLARAGFEDTVYDEAIVGGAPGNVGMVLGAAPGMVVEPFVPPKTDRQALVRAFKAYLADHAWPDNIIESYAMTFYHSGKFVPIRTDTERAEQVKQILRSCRASQVNQHG